MKSVLPIFILFLDACFCTAPKIYTETYNGIPTFDNVTIKDLLKDSFVKLGSKLYYFELSEKVNWFEAVSRCRALGAELVSIQTELDFKSISDYIIARHTELSQSWITPDDLLKTGPNFVQRFWISGNDLDSEGSYFWLGSGHEMKFFKWGPEKHKNPEHTKNCINLYKEWYNPREYFMENSDCLELCCFICEMVDIKFVMFAIVGS